MGLSEAEEHISKSHGFNRQFFDLNKACTVSMPGRSNAKSFPSQSSQSTCEGIESAVENLPTSQAVARPIDEIIIDNRNSDFGIYHDPKKAGSCEERCTKSSVRSME